MIVTIKINKEIVRVLVVQRSPVLAREVDIVFQTEINHLILNQSLGHIHQMGSCLDGVRLIGGAVSGCKIAVESSLFLPFLGTSVRRNPLIRVQRVVMTGDKGKCCRHSHNVFEYLVHSKSYLIPSVILCNGSVGQIDFIPRYRVEIIPVFVPFPFGTRSLEEEKAAVSFF